MPDACGGAEEPQSGSLFGGILEPGSSLDPTFLLVVDGVFASLFVVLVALAVLTRGNVHLIVLTFIELALWASVKWYVIFSSDSSPRTHGIVRPQYIGSSMNGTWRKIIMAHHPTTSRQRKIEACPPHVLLTRSEAENTYHLRPLSPDSYHLFVLFELSCARPNTVAIQA